MLQFAILLHLPFTSISNAFSADPATLEAIHLYKPLWYLSAAGIESTDPWFNLCTL